LLHALDPFIPVSEGLDFVTGFPKDLLAGYPNDLIVIDDKDDTFFGGNRHSSFQSPIFRSGFRFMPAEPA